MPMGRLITLLSDSSIPGFSQAASSRNYLRRTMWVLSTFVSLSGFIYSSYGIICTFSSDNISTSINVDSANPVQFPAITLCNINPFECLKLRKSDISLELKGINNACKQGDYIIDPDDKRRRRYRILRDIFSLGNEKRADLGQSFDSLIRYCEFNNERCSKK